MTKIYRVSGLKSAGSASGVARAISSLSSNVKVSVDVEQGLVNVRGFEDEKVNSDYMVANAVRETGCIFLGVEAEE